VDCITCLLDLPTGQRIADVGAGTGNYSRAMAACGFRVKAVEPSRVMRDQAVPHSGVEWIAGTAEEIPLAEDSVGGVIAIFASHHFSSLDRAISEMGRVCRRGPIVWLTFDPRQGESPWLAEYFPDVWQDAFAVFPPLQDVMDSFRSLTTLSVEASPFLLPHDLKDCFMAAGWRRPEMYFNPDVRGCISAFALADQAHVARELSRLEQDLEDGTWHRRFGAVLDQDVADWGYRFLCARDYSGARIDALDEFGT
jgi:ubiquinone/menaquinone biosynthesis C-methylase UbiE